MPLRSAAAELADAVLYRAASVLAGWWLRLIGRAWPPPTPTRAREPEQ